MIAYIYFAYTSTFSGSFLHVDVDFVAKVDLITVNLIIKKKNSKKIYEKCKVTNTPLRTQRRLTPHTLTINLLKPIPTEFV